MNDGNCACGTCHCPGYDEALAYAQQGCMSLFLVKGDHLSFTAYDPTAAQLEVLVYPDQRVRGAAQSGMAQAIDPPFTLSD